MAKKMAKRFYKSVTIDGEGRDWRVLLDGMQLRTPGKVKLTLPSKPLAARVASEWGAQTDHINPSVMPVTRLVNVAIEQTPSRRAELIAEARRYAETDLLCYRAPQPRVLQERQSAAWDDWLDWASGQGVELHTTEALKVIAQPKDSLAKVEAYAAGLDDLHLTLFIHLVAVYGSVVLAMAVMLEAMTADQAFELSRVDAAYQIELWGEDEEQADITTALREETIVLGAVLGL